MDMLASQSTNPSVWQPPYRILTIGLMLTITAAAFETLAVATILPTIQRELEGIELYGWAFSAFLLTKLIGITMAGSEVDRKGPALPFILGVLFFEIGLLLSGFAPTMLIFTIGRAIQGLGAGVIGSVVYAIIARGYPDTIRPRMLALNSTAWIVPGLIGPGIAGVIGEYVGWRWVFLGLIPLPIIALFLALPSLRLLDRQPTEQRSWQSARESVLLTIGAAMFMAGLGAEPLWAAGLIGGGLLIGLPPLIRLLPQGTFQARAGLPAAIACMCMLSLAFFGVDAFLPLALAEIRGESAVKIGIVLTACTMTWTAGSWLLDRYVTRFSRREFALAGFGLLGLGFVGSLPILLPTVSPDIAILSWAVAGLGIGLAYTTLSLVALELAPKGQEGMSAAALQIADVLGAAFGAGIGGALLANAPRDGQAQAIALQFTLMIGVVVIGLIAARGLPGAKRHAQAEPAQS
ncbi:MAG: MFS transporter [Roseiflexaceae bacterium]